MTRSNIREIISIIIGALLLGAALTITKLIPQLDTWVKILIFLVPYLLLGWSVIYDAIHGIKFFIVN